MRLPAVIAAALAAGFVVGAASPQEPPPQQQQRQEPPPVFRAGANFVAVDVYPRQDGRLVEGLTRHDFEVFEDGKPQTLETFEFIRIPPYTPTAARRDPGTAAEAEQQASDPRGRLFVLYLDGDSLHWDAAHRARAPSLEFLYRSIGPNDLFGVMTPGASLERLTFGRRLETAEANLQQYWHETFVRRAGEETPGASPRLIDATNPHEEFLTACFINRHANPETNIRLINALIRRYRAERVISDVRDLGIRLGGLRQQRSIVLLFSGGLSTSGDANGLLQNAWGTGVPRPSVSPRGTLVLGSGQPTEPGNKADCDAALFRLAQTDHQRLFREVIRTAQQNNVSFYPVDPTGLEAPEVGRPSPEARLDTLRTLAAETGGRAIIGNNDFRTPLLQLADDLAAYYLLGYYSTNGTFDGRFRRIEVKLRRPGVDVSARRGYLAPTEEIARAASAAREAAAATRRDPTPVAEAVAELSRARSADLTVRAVVSGNDVIVVAEVARAAAARLVPSGGTLSVSVVSAAGEPAGQVESAIAPGTRGAEARVEVDPRAGPWRVLVEVAGEGEPLREQVPVARDRLEVLGPPLAYRAMPSPRAPLVPVADFHFRRTERVRVEWAIIAPLESRTARLLGRDGTPLPIPVTLTETTRAGSAILAADMPLAPLTEGDYVIEVSATAAGEPVERHVAIRVER